MKNLIKGKILHYSSFNNAAFSDPFRNVLCTRATPRFSAKANNAARFQLFIPCVAMRCQRVFLAVQNGLHRGRSIVAVYPHSFHFRFQRNLRRSRTTGCMSFSTFLARIIRKKKRETSLRVKRTVTRKRVKRGRGCWTNARVFHPLATTKKNRTPQTRACPMNCKYAW